jgi:hypothetical protein
MRPVKGTTGFQMPAPGLGNNSQPVLRRLLKAFSRLRRIEPKIAVRQRLTTLLVVVVMLQHYTRLVPFP